jgi:hypothetical protein
MNARMTCYVRRSPPSAKVSGHYRSAVQAHDAEASVELAVLCLSVLRSAPGQLRF